MRQVRLRTSRAAPCLPGRARAPANERRAPLSRANLPLWQPLPPRANLRYPWHEVRPAMVALVRTRLTAFARAASSSEAEASAAEDAALFLADALASFNEAPFTVQRLCELLLAPTAYYAKPDKLTRAVEKLLNVTGMVPSPTAPRRHLEPEDTAPSSPARRAAKDPARPADGVRVLACRRRRRSKNGARR